MRILVMLALLAVPGGTLATQQKEVIRMPGQLEGLPFSPAVRVGNLLFLSGQVATVPGTGDLVPGGIQAETRQVLENIKAVLEYAGSSMDRVVKCTVFLADINEWAAMNEVYRTFFPVDPPARSAFGAAGIPLNGRLEIECIAVVGES